MGFFDVEDGEGGSVEDRIAIIAVVAFAFSWIPIFLIWKCITVLRRKDGNGNGNSPVTTHPPDPEKHPQPVETTPEPEARPEERSLPTSEDDHRHYVATAPTGRGPSARSKHSDQSEQPSSSNRCGESQGPRSSKRVHKDVDAPAPAPTSAPAPSRHQQRSNKRPSQAYVNDHQQGSQHARL